MKSISKNYLTEEQIKALVKVSFGEHYKVADITELKGGMFNCAYLIECSGENNNMVLKVSIKPDTKTLTYEKDLMPTEVAVYKMIEENTTILAPQVLSYDFSKKELSSNYFFMTALEGIGLLEAKKKMSKENLEEIKKELTGYLAQLHQIKGTYFGYFTEDKKYHFKTWKDAFCHMMRMVLADGKQNKMRLPYDRYEKVLKEKSNWLEEIKEPTLIDYDLWAGNVFVKKQGEHYVIEGIIDFERAFWGDPMADFSGSVMLLDNIFEEDDLWREYQEKAHLAHEVTKEDRLRKAFYSLYIYTIMAVETFRYGFFYGKAQKLYAMKNINKYLRELEEG